MKLTGLRARDIRFPTSRQMDGSDSLNVGDYSATYVTLETDGPLVGHGLTFTNGRGNEIGVAAAKALGPLVAGRSLEEITADLRGFYRRLTQDPQKLRHQVDQDPSVRLNGHGPHYIVRARSAHIKSGIQRTV